MMMTMMIKIEKIGRRKKLINKMVRAETIQPVKDVIF